MEKDFSSFLDRICRENADRPAFMESAGHPQQCVTYADLAGRVKIRMRELESEKTVVLRSPASVDWVVTMFASAIGGHMTVLESLAEPEIPAAHFDAGKEYHPGCLLFFTSGTTSAGKAVVLSQAALLASAWNGQQMLPCHSSDRVLSMLPLTHVFGFVCTMLWPLSQGACVQIGAGMRGFTTDPKAFDPTILPVVPTLLAYLLKADALNKNLRVVLIGAGPCSEKVLKATAARGISVYFGYGLTETASGLAISQPGHDPLAMVLCPDTQAKVSEEGELLVKTPCLMDGYYDDPEDTARKVTDGWLHTGDLAQMSADQKAVYIKGRCSDVLVLGNGEKSFCPEAEQKLTELLQTELALTVADGVLTLVVRAPFSAGHTVEAAVDAYNKTVPIGRKIEKIKLTADPLPRTATGKIQRWKLPV